MRYQTLTIRQKQIGQMRQCRHFSLEKDGAPRLLRRIGMGKLQLVRVNMADDITEQIVGKLECASQPFADQVTGVFRPNLSGGIGLVIGISQLQRHHDGEDQTQRCVQ